MARIRTVKPEMAQDEDLASVSIEAQLLAVRILNHADDEGYFKANPALVKANCFPLIDSVNVQGMLQELSQIGFIRLSSSSKDGKQYGHIVKFLDHQKVNKPSPSKIKELAEFTEHSGSPTGILPVGKERKGKEQGKEGKGIIAVSDESPPAEDALISIPLIDKTEFHVFEDEFNELVEAYPAIDVMQELRNIRQWNISNPANRKTPGGIRRHITAWLQRQQDRAPRVANQGKSVAGHVAAVMEDW